MDIKSTSICSGGFIGGRVLSQLYGKMCDEGDGGNDERQVEAKLFSLCRTIKKEHRSQGRFARRLCDVILCCPRVKVGN